MVVNRGGRGHLVISWVACAATVSLLASTSLGYREGLSTPWAVTNALLHLVVVLFFVVGPPPKIALFSARMPVAVVLIVYSSWGVVLGAGNTIPPSVSRAVSLDALEHVTFAGFLVAAGAVLGMARRPATRRFGEASVPSRRHLVRWWRFGLFLDFAGLAAFLLYAKTSGQSLTAFSIFHVGEAGAVAGHTIPDAELQSPEFLLQAIDLMLPGTLILVTVGRALARTRWGLLALALNLAFFATLGFKYRLLVAILAALLCLSAQAVRGRTINRQLTIALGLGLAMVLFFVVDVTRVNHDSGVRTTAEAFHGERIAESARVSIDIIVPYAAIHDLREPLLGGTSYTQLPALLIPRVIYADKPTPAIQTVLAKATNPIGAAIPLWGEAEANFGLPGLLAFGALLGLVLVLIDSIDRGTIEGLILSGLAVSLVPNVLSRSQALWAVQELIFVITPVVGFQILLSRSGHGWLRGARGDGVAGNAVSRADHAAPVP